MALAYLGVARSQQDLARRLGVIQDIGAPASQILRLRTPPIEVVFRTEAKLDDIRQWLQRRAPVIAFVQTSFLSYWNGQIAQHAVVVVGIDEQLVYLHDPGKQDSVMTALIDEFWLAWDEMGLTFAVLYRR